MKVNIPLSDCDIWWYKSYNYHFGRIPQYAQQGSQIINRVKVVGVPFVASSPTIVSAYTYRQSIYDERETMSLGKLF
jgi:hypothetical protein